MAVPFLHSSEGERRTINPDLWHACAGPRVSMPAVGSLVVYFPQGHSEQVAALTQTEVDGHIPNYPNLQPHLFCQLHNVALHADQETDEVFAQMTLQPVNEQDKDPFLPPDLSLQNRQPTDFFCKTLTASDTSTHGGFSVPRRAAEKVFPPLDFQKQPPAQEIVARDLHNQIWRFRHIYRGQPKRHLLTTGWSVFVSAKRLVAGDSVLFIRDEKGQLLLGIRRANRQQTVMPSSVLSSDSMHIGVLAAAAHAAATSSRFQVFYNPRASPSEFVIPLAKFKKAVYCTQVSVGMRFRMVFETEESTLRRYMGTITGSGDLDPERWPGSKWRNLEVGWDESSAGERPRRVSVWEIEPVSTPFLICPPPFSMRLKRPSHPGLLGDEGDMDGNMKRCLTWLRGENSNRDAQNCTFQNLGGDTSWTRLPRAELAQPDFYNAIPGTTFQEFKNIDASKFLQQQSQQLQFRLLQQRQQPLMQQEQQQQHILWPQSNVHQQQVFQNHYHQQQHQLPALQPQSQPQPQPQPQPQLQTQPQAQPQAQLQPQPQPQLQTQPQPQSQRPPLATPQPMPQQSLPLPQPHLQSPLSNQHHYPNYHQQQQLLVQPTPLTQPQQSLFQAQQQVMQKSDVPAHLLQLSFSRPQASLSSPNSNLPVSMKPCTMFSESELAIGSSTSVSANAFSLQGMIGRSHVGTLTSDDNGQLSSLIRSNQCILQQPPLPSQQQSQGALSVPSNLAQIETQITGSWFPSTRESSIGESPVPSNMQIGQSDSSSTITSCSFSLPPESLGQTGFTSLPLQSSSFAFRESSQDEEVQADTCSQMMFGVSKDNPLVLPSTTGSFQLRNANINKDMNGRVMSGNMTGSISSPSGSFTAATPDVPMNHGMVTNGGLDEALLQRGCNWPQIPTAVRTFTKVHKSGSVGRSIDVSRLKNYDELRRELARMFNIEGQLEDPQRSCWQLVFVDNENDVLLVGDDPWDEFVSCVRVIKILSPAQVLQMNHESLEPLGSLPMQQQQSSSSEDCQIWKDTRDTVAGIGCVDHGTN